jgi:hypothetical protein
MASTIKLKNGSGAPTAGDLVQGEPALDLTNKRLYTEDSGGTVIEVGVNPTSITTGAITSTGIDVTGTATMDGLTVDGVAKVLGTAGNTLIIADATETNGYQLKANTSASADFGFLIEDLAGKDLLKIESNNDISFYEDTGTTPKFFWDASAESLGIGTSSPASTLEIAKNDQTNGATLSITNTYNAGDYNAGDVVGTINFRTDDVSTTQPIRGQIKVFDDTSVSTTYPAYNAMSFSTGLNNTLNERLRIDSSGNVGIGTSSPSAKVDIRDIGGRTIQLGENPTTNYYGSSLYMSVDIGATEKAFNIGTRYSAAGGDLVFEHSTNDMGRSGDASALTYTERMRIDGSGNLLVGTTGWTTGGGGLRVTPSGRSDFSRNTTSSTQAINFANPNGFVGNITLAGSATAYNTSSDYRLKEDVKPMAGAVERVLALKPCNFAWKVDGSRVDGFIAHEAQEVVPEAVHGTKDAMRIEEYEVSPAVYEDVNVAAVFEDRLVSEAVLDDEGNEVEAAVYESVEVSPERTEQQLVTEAVMGEREVPDYQGIDQSKLVPLLTAALQEALTEIQSLKDRVAALEA